MFLTIIACIHICIYLYVYKFIFNINYYSNIMCNKYMRIFQQNYIFENAFYKIVNNSNKCKSIEMRTKWCRKGVRSGIEKVYEFLTWWGTGWEKVQAMFYGLNVAWMLPQVFSIFPIPIQTEIYCLTFWSQNCEMGRTKSHCNPYGHIFMFISFNIYIKIIKIITCIQWRK